MKTPFRHLICSLVILGCGGGSDSAAPTSAISVSSSSSVQLSSSSSSTSSSSTSSSSVSSSSVSSSSSTASSSVAIAGPVGIFSLDSMTGTYRDGNLRDYDFVKGYAWRYGWSSIETAQNTYDFTALDYILSRVAAKNQKLSWIIMPTPNTSAEPAYVLAQATTWTDKTAVVHAQPWDAFTLARFKAFLDALAAHQVADPAQGGAMVPLTQHSAFYAVNITFPGVPNLAIRDKRDNIVDVPGYTRTGFQEAILANLRAARAAFPKQFIHFGFWKFQNDTQSGESWEALRDRVLAEFGNTIGMYQDNLAATRPCITCDPYTGSPVTDYAAPLTTSMHTTYIGFQALASWSNPDPSYQAKVQYATPMDGIDFGLKTYNSRYVELYVADLDRSDWQAGLRAAAMTLTQ